MLVVIQPPELGLSTTIILENGQRQEWCAVSILNWERDYHFPELVLHPHQQVLRHEGRYISWETLRYLVTGNHHKNSHDGMVPPTPRPFFQEVIPENDEQPTQE